jgi:hypothetical protein
VLAALLLAAAPALGDDSDPTDTASGYLDAVAEGSQVTAWTLCYPAADATLTLGRIDWGDDTTQDVGDGTADLTHTYTFGGAYTITLTCRDSSGNQFSDDAALVVDGPTESAAPSAEPTAVAGRTVPLARRIRTSGCTLGPGPDRRCSPGAYSAGLTRAAICARSFDPAALSSIPAALRRAVGQAYGVTGVAARTVAIDYVLPVALGGATGVANLFPRAPFAAAAARARAQFVTTLRQKVCAGTTTLRAAQRQLARAQSH